MGGLEQQSKELTLTASNKLQLLLREKSSCGASILMTENETVIIRRYNTQRVLGCNLWPQTILYIYIDIFFSRGMCAASP